MWGANGMAPRCSSTILSEAEDLYIDSVHTGRRFPREETGFLRRDWMVSSTLVNMKKGIEDNHNISRADYDL